MTQKEALREMVKCGGHSASWVCEQMGFSNKSTLSVLFGRKNVTVDLMIEVAKYLGYDLVLVPQEKRDPNRKPIRLELDSTKERTQRGTKKGDSEQ